MDSNWKSEELLKLGGGRKTFIFSGGLPYEGEVRKFSFWGGWGGGGGGGGGGNFLGGGSYPSAYYRKL